MAAVLAPSFKIEITHWNSIPGVMCSSLCNQCAHSVWLLAKHCTVWSSSLSRKNPDAIVFSPFCSQRQFLLFLMSVLVNFSSRRCLIPLNCKFPRFNYLWTLFSTWFWKLYDDYYRIVLKDSFIASDFLLFLCVSGLPSRKQWSLEVLWCCRIERCSLVVSG
jgi:hypothetical protein